MSFADLHPESVANAKMFAAKTENGNGMLALLNSEGRVSFRYADAAENLVASGEWEYILGDDGAPLRLIPPGEE